MVGIREVYNHLCTMVHNGKNNKIIDDIVKVNIFCSLKGIYNLYMFIVLNFIH